MAKKELKYFKRFNKLHDDITYCRLERMIRELAERGYEKIPKDALVAVECDDDVVVLSLDKGGYGVFMIKDQIRLPDFRLRLTEKQMQEFNGGEGIRDRFLFYPKEKVNEAKTQ